MQLAHKAALVQQGLAAKAVVFKGPFRLLLVKPSISMSVETDRAMLVVGMVAVTATLLVKVAAAVAQRIFDVTGLWLRLEALCQMLQL
jgi:hypothetical protein